MVVHGKAVPSRFKVRRSHIVSFIAGIAVLALMKAVPVSGNADKI
jgi:hypothetical protein